MTDSQVFNGLLTEFISDLSLTFTEYPELKMIHDSLAGILALDPANVFPIQFFRTLVTPYADKINNRDVTIFETKKLTLPGMTVDLSSPYEASDKETQNAIWEYLQQLTKLSVSAEKLPPEIITGIKNVVETIFKKINNGEITGEEVQNPLFLVQTLAQDPTLLTTVQQLATVQQE